MKTCKSLLLIPNKVSLDSVLRAPAKCWANKIAQSTPADFKDQILKYPNLTLSPIDPDAPPNDKGTFFERTCRVIIARTVRRMLKDASLATLNLNKKQWTWIDNDNEHEDVPTMLKFLFLEVNPSTVISILKYKQITEETKLSAYGNFVNFMLSKMQESHDNILEMITLMMIISGIFLDHCLPAPTKDLFFILKTCMISTLRILIL